MHALNIPSLCSQAIEVNKMRERERNHWTKCIYTTRSLPSIWQKAGSFLWIGIKLTFYDNNLAFCLTRKPPTGANPPTTTTKVLHGADTDRPHVLRVPQSSILILVFNQNDFGLFTRQNKTLIRFLGALSRLWLDFAKTDYVLAGKTKTLISFLSRLCLDFVGIGKMKSDLKMLAKRCLLLREKWPTLTLKANKKLFKQISLFLLIYCSGCCRLKWIKANFTPFERWIGKLECFRTLKCLLQAQNTLS